ncbi:phosphatidylinositol-4- kinase [Allomyces arbusculus]|nr:phosphatidylinositol-4- kinase [Allomyces arbusculus]
MRPRLHAKLWNEIALLAAHDSPSQSADGDWDNVAALIAKTAHASVQQPDRLAHDVAVLSARNAAATGLPAAVDRVVEAVWTTTLSLVRDVAHATDFHKLTASWLPALIGLLRALADMGIDVPAATLAKSWDFLVAISRDPHLLDGVSDNLAKLDADPLLARYRRRLATYWQRRPFSPDVMYLQCITFVRNALAMYITRHHLAPATADSQGTPALAAKRAANAAANGVPDGGDVSDDSQDDRASGASLQDDRSGSGSTGHGGPGSAGSPTTDSLAGLAESTPASLGSMDRPDPDFAAAWARLLTSPQFVNLDAHTMPRAVMEQITKVCLQHYAVKKIPEIMAVNLQTCCLAWLLSPLTLDAVIPILFDTFASASTPDTIHAPVLVAAAESLAILVSALASPAAISQVQSFLVDLLTRPHPAFALLAQRNHGDDLPRLRTAVIQALTACALASPPGTRLDGTLYSLFRNASGDVAQVKFDNCCAAVAALTCAVRPADDLDAVVTFFTRMFIMPAADGKASSPGTARTESTHLNTLPCLRYLADIALVAPLNRFGEIVGFFSKHAKENLNDDAVSRVVVECVDRMSAAATPVQRRIVLHTLLTFFVDKASYVWTQARAPGAPAASKADRADLSKLLFFISKMCHAVHDDRSSGGFEALTAAGLKSAVNGVADGGSELLLDDGSTSGSVPTNQSFQALFRSMWYFIVVLDFVSDDAAQDHVVDIALYSPYVQFASVIESYFQSPAHKVRLAQLLASPALATPLTVEQALYLVTMFHVMCCCASESKLAPLALLETMVPHKQLFPTFLQLLDHVMAKFFYGKKPPRGDKAALVTLAMRLLEGAMHPHDQIATTCLTHLARLVERYPALLYSRAVLFPAVKTATDKVYGAAVMPVLARWVAAGRPALLVTLLASYIVDDTTRPVAPVLAQLPAAQVNDLTWFMCQLSAAHAQGPYLDVAGVLAQCDAMTATLQDGDGTAAQDVVQMQSLLLKLVVVLIHRQVDMALVKQLVYLPLRSFARPVLHMAVRAWHALLLHRPDLESSLFVLLERAWHLYVIPHRGLFRAAAPVPDPLADKVNYTGEKYDVAPTPIEEEFAATMDVLEFLADRLECSLQLPQSYLQLLLACLDPAHLAKHGEARAPRFALLALALRASQHSACTDAVRDLLRARATQCALHWFALNPQWARTPAADAGHVYAFWRMIGSALPRATAEVKLLRLLVASELDRLATWASPDNPPPVADDVAAVLATVGAMPAAAWRAHLRTAAAAAPAIGYQLAARFHAPPVLVAELEAMTRARAHVPALHACTLAVPYLVTASNVARDVSELRYLAYWAPVPPIQAVGLLQPVVPETDPHPVVVQYALRSLMAFPIQSVFFFVPQIVQALRHDPLGYVFQYIVRAAHTSPVFAHQIIWNMKANMYRDEAGNEPDALQPVFDAIINQIITTFSPGDLSFYEREFAFFNKVTAISGKLKPYIKRSKPEKKKKIDEELAQIQVDVGCYLPSNPESTVVGIDYQSGRPLQSHAKAPFLATFQIERQTLVAPFRTERVWQSAIFKVGDDCRQDVLALQLIALFKSIFAAAHLDLYLFPYRVVATAPGCGVIEVIPKAISRDMMGREKINSLYDYFVAKYGLPHTAKFRAAQHNFITSVAGYSVILYLLQIKDRHNGNVMIDDDGHLLHIDFGFILDISPGGINFESSPFKLTSEMIQIIGPMGTDSYKHFQNCVVQAFLAARPFAAEVVAMVQLLAESGLPCFKGEATLRKLRARFVLDKSDRDAAKFMMDRINESYENKRTVWYDEFQKQTNGIPY